MTESSSPRQLIFVQPRSMRRAVLSFAWVLVVAALCWRFPLFHVVSLASLKDTQKVARVNAARVVSELWERDLPKAAERAPSVKEFLAALASDPKAARKRFGRAFGISSATLFLLGGTGRVSALESETVVVTLDGSETKIDLATGFVFGSTVRDSLGLLDVSSFASSQDFNEISVVLNGRVEASVTPLLRSQSVVGRAIRFAGCVELEQDAKPVALRLVPIRVEWL